ncbi:MAG: PIN domain-containing protein [Candidatus Sumerlaeota bacterium]|nr:PIN domain-containing protein [Candidatus Sumerlaeota bacterium]
MPGATEYVLDTNIVLLLARGGPAGSRIDEKFGLSQQTFKPFISVVTIGEMLKLTRDFGWGKEKIDALWERLHDMVWVGLEQPGILEVYAEIAHYCEQTLKPACTKPQNDYWIAATARGTGATLLTTDKHFDDLQDLFIQRIWIDKALGKR